MPGKVTKAKLAELQQAGIPRMDWRDLLDETAGNTLTDEDRQKMADYFKVFVPPPKDGAGCISCGHPQGGSNVIEQAFLANFRWGLAHGEGYCINCGWPARGYHYNVGPIKKLSFILQYHPDELSL